MPTYSYRCDNCGHHFDAHQSMTATALVTCPECGKDALRKVMAGISAIVFKGSGFYHNDSRSSGGSSTQN
ncbi:FmdB family zinc ribbon protein [Actinotignum sp. GS-2025g]|uniref:FmdB family zinc ribbon protein n=1 Tax=Actinotignum TaxID=1653174 RepID=UPI00254D77E7|nr:FmdB family zinc ribbon protein [Actinotignum timonense]MDK6926555.1 zinc ribbon domain-containing protein [Actinotignum timonense]